MDAASAPAHTGRHLAITKYDVVEEIGHGGMATVYRAHDARLGRDVALKVIHPHLRDSPEVKHRFFVEAQAVAKLRHPNIVEVFDVSSESEAEQYLVVELLRGVTLRKLLRDHGALPPEVAVAITIELLGALAHAHGAGVVHRDVKPENVIIELRPRDASTNSMATDAASLGESGSRMMPSPDASERVVVKLTDFGIAKLLDAQGVTSTGQVLGSPAHMAPEQIEGGDVDERADVFGLGVLLYECLVGHLPFEGNNPAQVLRRVLDGIYPAAERERPTVGRPWSKLVDRALARKPEDRFPSATAMRDALVTELRRLGMVTPRAELEAWLDAPDAYAARHKTSMIDVLCARGSESRKSGDAIAAAADYNRALAYAPDDAALLRVVTTMHRADARSRFLRRAARALGVALVLCGVAFALTRTLTSAEDNPTVVVPPRTDGIGRAVPRIPNGVAPVATAEPSITPTATPSSATNAALPSRPPAPPPARAIERVVTVASTWPHFGVLVAVDEGAPAEVTVPYRIALDGKAHELHFACVSDVCEPRAVHVDEGAHEDALTIVLSVRPASLTVEGDPTLTYQVVEEPSVYLRAGVAAPVPMRQYKSSVHILELPSNRTREVPLTAGKEARVTFLGAP